MDKFNKEKRIYPRTKTGVRIGLSNTTSAECIDLSEGGACFNSVETISSPVISLQVNIQDKKINIDAKLIWKRDLTGGESLYGMQFFNLDEQQKAVIRKELMKTQISELLSGIKDRDVRKQVYHFFAVDTLNYITELLRVSSHLSAGNQNLQEAENKFFHLTNQILLKGYRLEEVLGDKILTSKNKELFRFLVGTWAYKSPIVKRAFEKPRGYPGDYLMLETIYNNLPLAKDGIGLYFDKYFLSNSYAVAVRYRKDKLREILHNEINQSVLKTIKIFNMACGSCREIKELPTEIFQNKTVVFTCLDWDEDALDFSRMAVKGLAANVKFDFVKEDMMNLIKGPRTASVFEKQDLVYSIGLIDYLPDRVLKLFMQFFYGLLKDKSKLILTHKNKEKTFSPIAPDWFCNWKFVPRNKEEVMKLFYNCGIKNFDLSAEVDEFSDIFYFTITKY